jgi:hypothetical protein
MSLIPSPPAAPDKGTLPVRLERALLLELRDYAEFLGSTKEYVVSAALRRVFRHDKAFLAWQHARQTDAAPDAADHPTTSQDVSVETAAPQAHERSPQTSSRCRA